MFGFSNARPQGNNSVSICAVVMLHIMKQRANSQVKQSYCAAKPLQGF